MRTPDFRYGGLEGIPGARRLVRWAPDHAKLACGRLEPIDRLSRIYLPIAVLLVAAAQIEQLSDFLWAANGKRPGGSAAHTVHQALQARRVDRRHCRTHHRGVVGRVPCRRGGRRSEGTIPALRPRQGRSAAAHKPMRVSRKLFMSIPPCKTSRQGQLGSGGRHPDRNRSSSACSSSSAWGATSARCSSRSARRARRWRWHRRPPRRGKRCCRRCTSGLTWCMSSTQARPTPGTHAVVHQVGILADVHPADVHEAMEPGDDVHPFCRGEPLRALVVADAVARREVHEAQPSARIPPQAHLVGARRAVAIRILVVDRPLPAPRAPPAMQAHEPGIVPVEARAGVVDAPRLDRVIGVAPALDRRCSWRTTGPTPCCPSCGATPCTCRPTNRAWNHCIDQTSS
jgi:hypothetical protein